MWLAVCSHKYCQWERAGFSRTSAEANLGWHTIETGHRGAAVDVPETDPQRKLDLARLANNPAA